MRSVVLDTETTGMPVTDGHRIIEIGCVELEGRRLTGRHFHVYLNPDREIDEGAIAVHGITNEFVADKPRFKDVADEFFAFIEGAQLIIHNAAFDVGFINNEFALLGQSERSDVSDYCSILDTLLMARERHPGQRNNLDALCKRYGVDNSGRDLHGAFQHVQLRADGEQGKHVGVGAQLARQRRVALARGVTDAQQQAPRGGRADRLNQLAPQGPQRGRMHQQHALAGQPDPAIGRRELHLAAQIGGGGQGWQLGHGSIIDKDHLCARGWSDQK